MSLLLSTSADIDGTLLREESWINRNMRVADELDSTWLDQCKTTNMQI